MLSTRNNSVRHKPRVTAAGDQHKCGIRVLYIVWNVYNDVMMPYRSVGQCFCEHKETALLQRSSTRKAVKHAKHPGT